MMPGAEIARSNLDRLVRDGKIPGIQYRVVAPEGIAFEYTCGWADLARRRQLNADTTLMAYSMSKTITAAAVLQLVDAQKIALAHPIDVYLPSQPYGPDVTVRQLLSHTSGIPNPIPLRWVHPAAFHDSFDEHAALTRVLHQYPRLSVPPGTRFKYSNIGYWLLGRIVESASGKSFPAYVREHILEPLGITAQELGYSVPDIDNHAKGYLEKYSAINLVKRFLIDRDLIGDYEGPWLHLRAHYVNGAAFGGLVGTAAGFAKFLQDQLRAHSLLFANTTRDLFFAPQHTRAGTSIPMTLGWHIGAVGRAQFFYKEGGGGGFHSMMRIYPASRIATVVLTNATTFDVRGLLDAIDPPCLASTATHLGR